LWIKRTTTVTKRKVREGEPVIAVMQNKLFVNEVKDLDLSGQTLNLNEG